MRVIEVNPTTLAGHPGFLSSLSAMREETELEQFSGPPSFDLAEYERLHANDLLSAFMIEDGDALVAWATVLHIRRAARAGAVMQIDAIYSAPGSGAGGQLFAAIHNKASERKCPLIATAPVGGRMDRMLGKRARKTHHVYVING